MIKKYKLHVIIAISALLIGRYVLTPKQEIKQVIKIVEVEKNVKEEKKKVTTKIKETTKPDGSKVTETNITEDSSGRETSVKDTNTNVATTVKSGSGLTLGLLAIKDLDNFQSTEYGITATIPIIGNLKAVALGTTGKQVGLGLAVEF